MNTASQGLPTLPMAASVSAAQRHAGWLRATRQAKLLSWFSLAWMLAEGIFGLVLGAETHSVAVTAWAIGSAVEGAAAVIVIIRFTGRHRFSPTAERRAQRWVAASFFLLIPYVLYQSISHLIAGERLDQSWAAVALLVSSVLLMPALGWAKHRLGRRLGSRATAGEGTQNLLCALQGGVAIVALLLGSAGAAMVDPAAALVIVALATREGLGLWRGEEGCCTPLGATTSDCDCC